MSGPTLKLDVTSPGQKSVEGTTTAVKALAAALRDLPKASADLLKLQQALAGGVGGGGLSKGTGDLKELVGEIKNLGAQLNTSFGSLEETIKKGLGKSRKAYVEESRKTEEDIREAARRMAAAQALAQAEFLSKSQALGDRRRLKAAASSEAGTRQLLYGSDTAVLAQMASYYKKLEAADTSASDALARQLLANAEKVSKARAAAHQKLLARASGSEAVTRGLLYNQGPESLATLAQMASYYRGLEAADTSAAKSKELVAKNTDDVGKKAKGAKPHVEGLSKAFGDAHSAARGLASGLGLIYLTWGSLGPLLAGAAASNSFVKSLKIGAQVRQELETVRVLSMESTEAVAGLQNQLLELGRTGPAGPKQLAEGARILSLAGLSIKEVSLSLKPVMDFAVTGQIPLEKAAETLTAVGTAYGYQAGQYSLVADQIAKAAAVSMSSVDAMAESFRSSSVIAQAYGVTLRDTATGLAVLANIGIRGSAAGTALRQGYSELSGATKKTRTAMAELGLSVVDANGDMRDLLSIARDLSKELDKLSGPERLKAIQALANQRGSKFVAGIVSAFDKDSADGSGTSNLERLRKQLQESAAFNAISAAQLATTPLKLMEGAVASFETALVKAFLAIEDQLIVVSVQLREFLNSEEFKKGVGILVSGMAGATKALVDHAGHLAALGVAYAAFKGFQLLHLALTSAVVIQEMYAARAAASAAATAALGAASAAAAPPVTRLAFAAGALGTALKFLGPVAVTLGLATLAWEAYSNATSDAKKTEQEAAGLRQDLTIKSLDAEIARLTLVEKEMRKGVSARLADVEAQKEQARVSRALKHDEERLELFKAEAAAKKQLSLELAREQLVPGYSLTGRAGTAMDAVIAAQQALRDQDNAFRQREHILGTQMLVLQGRSNIVENLSEARPRREGTGTFSTLEPRTVSDLVPGLGKGYSKAFGRTYDDLKPLGQFKWPDFSKPPALARPGGAWQWMLEDWQQVNEQLIRDRDDFMSGWIDRGRSIWADWMINGKLTFKSLADFFKQTFADIVYKRFIAAPMAKFGESVFDTLLKPVAEVKPGAGDASSNLQQAFSGLSDMASRLGQSLGGLGQDFWRLLVQVGQGLASMLSSSGASGIGNMISSFFGSSGGSGNGGTAGMDLWANAKGNAFNNGVYAFANGGLPMNSVINSPHFFKFGAGKLGVAGEDGPEAIMPLERGPGGRLGVRAMGGGGGYNVTNVNVVVEKHGDGNGPVTQSRETQPDGSELIRVVLNATAKDIARGGTVRKSMQSVAGKKNLPRY